MVLEKAGGPLRLAERPEPAPGPLEARLRVLACGVCRTDLHLMDGELEAARYPVVPGHEIVGVVEALGEGAEGLSIGQRMGVGWLGRSCGACRFCRSGRENLCEAPVFTGATRDGGYASHVTVDSRFAYPLPEDADPTRQAPLLCAGLIGWRCLSFCGEAERLGLYGFGAAGHIVCQAARAQGRRVFAFTRPGDVAGQAFARSLGAEWAGGSDEAPPKLLEAAIIFAPVGGPVPKALVALERGGHLVLGGIHMSDIPAFPYRLIWGEREVRSVANLTRADARAFLAFVRDHPMATTVRTYPLAEAAGALSDLRTGAFEGAAVLVP